MKQQFLLFALVLCINTNAQSVVLKDEQLNTLIKKAINNYPKIKELEEQIKVFDIKDKLTNSIFQPVVNGNINYRLQAPVAEAEFGNNKIQFTPYNNYNANLSISQLIYDFGKTALQLKKNNADKAINVALIDVSKNAVAYQVATIYYGIIYLQKIIVNQQQQLEVLKQNEKQIKSKYDNGDALRYDVLTTQVKSTNANNKLKDFISQQNKQYILLQWLTGDTAKANIILTNEMNPFELIAITDNWQQSNPDAIVADKKIVLLNYEIKSAAINTKPSLITTGSAGFINGLQPNINQIKPAASIGIGINIPIISASKPKLQQQIAEVNISTLKKSLLSIQSNIVKDLAIVNEDYENLKDKLLTTNLLIQQAEQAFQLAQVRYKAGLITSVELLSAQSNVEDSKLQQVQLQYQMQLDKIESNKIVGTKIW
jgi:outer membrane protein